MKKFMFLFAAMFAIFAVNNSFSQADEGKAKMPNPRYEITVTQTGKELGKILIELYANEAPKHTANFDSLVTAGAFNGTAFHRVIPGFMIQGGDPDGTGMGGPGYGIKGEFASNGVKNPIKHLRGVISMARSSMPNSAGSQFFIMHEDAPHLDGGYAAFGHVVNGIEVVDEIAAVATDMRDKPKTPVVMKKVEIIEG